MTIEDVDNLMEIFSDPIAMEHYPSTKKRDEVIKWVGWTTNNYLTHDVGLWIVEGKTSGEFLGQCGIVPQDVGGQTEMEIGYLFKRSVWGNGYATEAASACKRYGFDQLGYSKLISLIHMQNAPSIKVAERIGMSREQVIHKGEKDIYVYSCRKEG